MPFVWGSIIAAAQLLDALKGVFPFARQLKSAASLTVALELLLIDAEDEWENIHMGKITDDAIVRRRTRLKKLQLEAEQKYFPEGFEPSKNLVALATRETNTYLLVTYQMEVGLDGT